jgi:hypothetical protein
MLVCGGVVILVIAELNDFSRAYRTPAGPIVLRDDGPAGCGSLVAVAFGPCSGALDESLPRCATREGSFLLPCPSSAGELGALFVAAPVEDIPVAGQQRAGGDEVSGVLVAGEIRATRCGRERRTTVPQRWVRRGVDGA